MIGARFRFKTSRLMSDDKAESFHHSVDDMISLIRNRMGGDGGGNVAITKMIAGSRQIDSLGANFGKFFGRKLDFQDRSVLSLEVKTSPEARTSREEQVKWVFPRTFEHQTMLSSLFVG
jgi:hypothetical protein